MTKRPDVTCDDCFFRRADLCAIPGDRPCPTFRPCKGKSLEPPRQPRLVPRTGPGKELYAASAAA